jgi:hypothetical protein
VIEPDSAPVATTSSLADALRIGHTALFVLAALAVVHVVVCGLTGRDGFWLRVSLLSIAVIGISYVANGGECILRTWIVALEGGDQTVRDIHLPGAVARNIVPVSSVAFGFGCGLLVGRRLGRGRSAGEQPDAGRSGQRIGDDSDHRRA